MKSEIEMKAEAFDKYIDASKDSDASVEMKAAGLTLTGIYSAVMRDNKEDEPASAIDRLNEQYKRKTIEANSFYPVTLEIRAADYAELRVLGCFDFAVNKDFEVHPHYLGCPLELINDGGAQ
jgi:hypothetical protein